MSKEANVEELPELYLQQWSAIKDALNGYIERKLVIYAVSPNTYKRADLQASTETKWIEGSSLYEKYNINKVPFKVVLIGLDGCVKETRNDFFPTQELFTIIDGMSMRKTELRNKI